MASSLKIVHIVCVYIAFFGFFLRGVLMIFNSPALEHKALKVITHLVDTVLIASAIALAVILSYNPLEQPCLFTKITVLGLYIVLGLITFKLAQKIYIKVSAWLLGLASLGFMISVAVTKSPWGFFVNVV